MQKSLLSLPRLRLLTLTGLLSVASSCGSGGGSPGPVDPPGPPPTLELGQPSALAGLQSATLDWTTNLPTTALVEFYPTEPEATPQVIQVLDLKTQHQLDLTGLTPETTYSYRVTAYGLSGQMVASGFLNFTTDPLPKFESDDFYANNLRPDRWTFEDPLGGAELRMLTGSTGEGIMELSVPPGVNSSPWLTLNGARLTQQVEDQDVSIEAMFLSALDQNATGKGLVFEEDDQNWARFDFAFNGGKVQLFAAVFVNGQLQNMVFSNLQTGPWLEGNPLGMRVTRTGNNYLQEYSLDGLTWLPGPTMVSTMTLHKAGLFIAAEGNPPGGITAKVDYVQNQAYPIQNEDGVLAPDVYGPLIYGTTGTVLGPHSVDLAWGTEEPANAEIRYGQTPQMTGGLVTLSSLEYAQTSLIMGLDADTMYFFEIKSLDPLSQESTEVIARTTAPDNTIGSPEIAIWDADTDSMGNPVLRFGQRGFAQPQVNLLGNVTDPDEVRLVQTVTLEYRLNQGPWLALALGDDRTQNYEPWRLANEGDFNVEIMLSELTTGTPTGGLFEHDVLLRALDDEGHVTYQLIKLEIVDGAIWNPNDSIDWDALLTSGGKPSDAVQIVDGKWSLENLPGQGAVLRTDGAHLGYDRLVAIGQANGVSDWEDYEVTLDATVLALDPQGYTQGTNSYGFGFVVRWTGHTANGPYPQPNHGIYPMGAAWLYRWFVDRERWEFWRGYDEGITHMVGSTLVVGTRYSFKLRVEALAAGGHRYRMKQWAFGTTEPAAWTYDESTPATDPQDKGSLLLVAHHADVAFGNIQVTEL